MRSYKSKENFFKKMKKKPAIMNVVNNIDNYSVEDLQNLKGNQFPKWIREVLVKYKNRGGKTAEEMAEMFAAIMREKDNGEEIRDRDSE